MRVTRIGAAAAAAFLLTAGLAACGSDTTAPGGTDAPKSVLDKAKSQKKLTIGVKNDQPALGLKEPSGEVTGFDVDVAKYVANELGVPEDGITFKETISDNRETFIQGGQVDLVFATYSITEERKDLVTFGGPYYVAHQDTMVRADDTSIAKPQDLKGRKICKAKGSNSYKRITDPPPDGELNIKADTVPAENYSECVAKLQGKELDAVTTDDLILAGFGNQQQFKGKFKILGKTFTDEKYGIGMKKGDSATCEAVNKAVQKMYDSGKAKELLEKHFKGAEGLTLDTKTPEMEGCS